MPLFYAPDIAACPLLPDDEARHCLSVLRLTVGDEIRLTDGKGFFYRAAISGSHSKQCSVTVLEKYRPEPLWPFRLHIAIAPPKNIDRMEWFIEKATEVGIDAITCLLTSCSERKDVNPVRLTKIMASAIKQSHKATLPQLEGMVPFGQFITRPFEGEKLIAHCRQGEKPLLKYACPPGKNALLLIGPEGDFSPDEVEMAIRHGFRPVSLGKSRLRTETAALTACQTIHLINQ